MSFMEMVPAAYCASMFAYWRGSVDFVFKFVKTDFHSGRLMFVFNPGGSVADWARTYIKRRYHCESLL